MTTKLNDRITFEGTNHFLKSAVFCVQQMLKYEIPASIEEDGLLLQALTDLSKQQKNKDEITFKIKLDLNVATAIWHSCNVVVNNKELISPLNEGQIAIVLEVLSLLAEALDENLLQNLPPEEIKKVRPNPL